MFARRAHRELDERLQSSPAVALLGPRQVGKTTLALAVAASRPAVYLDLELPSDRAKLAEPELYLGAHTDKLVILDEIQRVPELFAVLRGLIDRGRRQGRGVGRFLVLGSASIDLLRQSSETLAGRISYLELQPLDVLELGAAGLGDGAMDRLWLRGGFPESYKARSERTSLRWRRDFVRAYLERDIPQLGPRIPAETLRRFWTMLAHRQSSLHNAAAIARGLGVTGRTVAGYLDLMVDLLLVRRLLPWHGNVGKRLVRSPKIYVRDSGLLHSLLGIADAEALAGHPIIGPSWEGFVIENLIGAAGEGVEAAFYRSSGGAEIDLLLSFDGGERWAIEVKRSLNPRPRRGFHSACDTLHPDRRFVVYPGRERFPITDRVQAVPLHDLATEVAAR